MLPLHVTEPLIYLSTAQEKYTQHLPTISAFPLPAWVPQQLLAKEMGFDTQGIETALRKTGGMPYLWATEFENVHTMWDYNEPELTIGDVTYHDSEHYYHAQKPEPFDESQWASRKDDVMRVALRAKLDADPALRALLAATKGHPLLSIKPDDYWGVHESKGGRNRLAELWTELRDQPPVPVQPVISNEDGDERGYHRDAKDIGCCINHLLAY